MSRCAGVQVLLYSRVASSPPSYPLHHPPEPRATQGGGLHPTGVGRLPLHRPSPERLVPPSTHRSRRCAAPRRVGGVGSGRLSGVGTDGEAPGPVRSSARSCLGEVKSTSIALWRRRWLPACCCCCFCCFDCCWGCSAARPGPARLAGWLDEADSRHLGRRDHTGP